jgi:superfamily II DNA/RNA helicase
LSPRSEFAPSRANAPRTRSTDSTRTKQRWSPQERAARATQPEARPTIASPPPLAADFGALGLPAPLVTALRDTGISQPFAIQSATIPDALAGRDVLGRGQTGSGKTLAFGLPMIARLADGRSRAPRGLVLVPTRELAMQVVEALAPLARVMSLSVTLVAGGMPYGPQIRAFERGVDLVVATPGRLIDLLEQGVVDLSRVEITVLDEADHMADLGFMPAVTTIVDAVPAGGQRLLFSATLDAAVNKLVRKYLDQPVTHEVDSGQATVATMEHRLVHIQPQHKVELTAELAGREGRTLVFVRTQRGADRVAEQLRGTGVVAGALHGGLSQNVRTRILAAFKDGQVPVLVATDVAARGIHVDDVGLVLQADPPAGPKDYLHRAGRTARAGGQGVVVTLALPHQRREVSRLAQQAGVAATPVQAQPGDAALAAATGARVPSGAPMTTAEYERLISPPRSAGRRGGDARGPRRRPGQGPRGPRGGADRRERPGR